MPYPAILVHTPEFPVELTGYAALDAAKTLQTNWRAALKDGADPGELVKDLGATIDLLATWQLDLLGVQRISAPLSLHDLEDFARANSGRIKVAIRVEFTKLASFGPDSEDLNVYADEAILADEIIGMGLMDLSFHPVLLEDDGNHIWIEVDADASEVINRADGREFVEVLYGGTPGAPAPEHSVRIEVSASTVESDVPALFSAQTGKDAALISRFHLDHRLDILGNAKP